MKLSRVEGWLRLAFWVLGLVLAATYVWRGRHVMWPDGIAYLDLADAFARKDWQVRVIAEVPGLSGRHFWQSPAAVKRRVIDTLVATGARAIVAAGGDVAAQGWLRLEGTTYLVCCINR